MPGVGVNKEAGVAVEGLVVIGLGMAGLVMATQIQKKTKQFARDNVNNK